MAKDYPAKLSAAARESFRTELVAAIPGWYQPWLHLLFPSLVGLALLCTTLYLLRDVRAIELFIVPAMVLAANAVEWRVHRDVLHRRQRLLEELYDRHTPMHHRLYVSEDMAIRTIREFRLVLMPAYAVLIIFACVVPLTAGIWLAGQRNVALLFFATCVAYPLSYEWLHLAYHLRADSFIGRLWLVRVLRQHHATHHAPELMQRWNFNVTLPLWDWLRGSTYRGPAAQYQAEEAADRQPAA